MGIDEDTMDYLICVKRAATGLRKSVETITDNLVIAIILKSIPGSFKPFVVVHTQLDKYKTLSAFKAALNNYSNTEAMRSTQEQSSLEKRGTNQRIAAQNQSYNANFVNDMVM